MFSAWAALCFSFLVAAVAHGMLENDHAHELVVVAALLLLQGHIHRFYLLFPIKRKIIEIELKYPQNKIT